MTSDERTRAILLEDTSREYCKTGRNKSVVTFFFIIMLILDALISVIMIKTNSPDGTMPFNVFMSAILFNFSTALTTSLVGDTTNTDKNNPAILKTGGTMTTGKFLSILPFRGKDVLNLRLIGWERQLIAKTVLSVLLQTELLILKGAGYEISDFICGAAVLLMFLGEIALLVDLLTRNRLLMWISGFGYAAFSFVGVIFLLAYVDGNPIPQYLETGAWRVFTGVSGIILTIALTAVFILAAEKYMSRRGAVSWGLC